MTLESILTCRSSSGGAASMPKAGLSVITMFVNNPLQLVQLLLLFLPFYSFNEMAV